MIGAEWFVIPPDMRALQKPRVKPRIRLVRAGMVIPYPRIGRVESKCERWVCTDGTRSGLGATPMDAFDRWSAWI